MALIGITGVLGAPVYRFILIRVRGMAISEIIASYAIGLAILEGLRWGGFKGMTYTLPVFIEGARGPRGAVDYQRILVVGIGGRGDGSSSGSSPTTPHRPGPAGDGPG